MRTYIVHATRGHYKISLEWPPAEWRSTARIRQFCIVAFQKYFGGLTPNFHWHKDGFMAEASDARGNHITVEQSNWWHCHSKGSTTMPRPLAPMILRKGTV